MKVHILKIKSANDLVLKDFLLLLNIFSMEFNSKSYFVNKLTFQKKIINLPSKIVKFTILKSPFVNKKARHQYGHKTKNLTIYFNHSYLSQSNLLKLNDLLYKNITTFVQLKLIERQKILIKIKK